MAEFFKNHWLLGIALFSVILLALVLRLIGIDKPDGLWHDEIITYNLCSLPLSDVFFTSFPRPLYHVILHYWMVLFGNTDVTIRFLSVIFGTLTVPVMYFAGQELEKYFKQDSMNNISRIGTTAAMFVAVNAFLIYYSQELRQYSLLALTAAMSAWAILRLINKPAKLNYILFFMVNALFVLTHFISALLIIPQVIFISAYLFINNKNEFNKFVKFLAVFSIPVLFALFKLIKSFIGSTITSESTIINSFSGVHHFDPQVIFILFQNYFSPVITGIYNNTPNYLSVLLSNISLNTVIFVLIPVVLSLWLIAKAVISNKKFLNPVYALLLPPLCFLAIVFTLSFLNTYVIVSRYTLLCLPFFILVMSKGIISFKNRAIPYSAVFYIILISLVFLIFNPHSAPKLSRPDGQKKIAELFNNIQLNEDDIVIFPRIKGTIDKYYPQKYKRYTLQHTFMNKNTVKTLIGEDNASGITMKNSDEMLKNYLVSEKYSPEFEAYVQEKFFGSLPESGHFILAHNKDVCFYTPELLEKIVNNGRLYEKNPLQFMMYSKISLNLFGVANKHLHLKQVRQNHPWTIFIFRKTGPNEPVL